MIWFLLIGLIIVSLVLIFLVEEFFNLMFKGYAPVVSSKNKVLSEAIKQFNELGLVDGAKIYELGCGQAGFLRKLEKTSQVKYDLIGVELIASVYLLARLQLSLLRSHIKLVRKDFLKMSLKDGDCFYCYLNAALMARLSLKLKQEAKSGAILISNQFHLPGYEPIKEIKLGLTNYLRVYKL